ncbi:MICOS complex subunit MIC27 isoform X9 [Sphaeramia orbicularis]|uniref:MICOS complex subunit MIC27 isoform X9 n=1 Tax=Sphaeramia orbicularis TaxID=375764 RepID=UPI00117DFE3F|nr:fibrous sheath CABYR-binding protein-like isoform X9 [Sphaeramia orbicularis]
MAAKAVMVAVPTVLGVASIRVYRVRDASADGITREKLTIYSPLEQSTQVQFVTEKPGLIESGFSATREAVLPFIQAVKGACVSVKRGSVNLYHAGEDVYYYLKDPPPDFIPRFGTITMAGLLGMFLARKGSRGKRVALPLGLMSAGASVCYPAQAVALFKVTGKKVYAAGQWSGAAVSSLFTPKAEEHVPKEIIASQSQVATGPAVVEEVVSGSNPASESNASKDSSAQSSTISEADVESAGSFPVQVEEAIVTVEESSGTLTETSPDQMPPDTSTESVVNSVASETETCPPSEELPAPVESEKPLDSTQTPGDVPTDASPAEPMPGSGPDTAQSSPTEAVPSTEEPSAATDQPAEAVAESAGPELAVEPPVAPVEETSTLTPPPPEQPTAEDNKEVVVESAEPEPELAVEPPVAPVEEPSTLTPPAPEQPTAEDNKEAVAESAEPEPEVASEPPVVPVEEPSTLTPPAPEQPTAGDNKEAVAESAEPEPEVASEPPVVPVEEPSTLTPPAPEQPKDDNKEAVAESAEPEPEVAAEPPVVPVEEPSVVSPPPPEQPTAEDNKGTIEAVAEAAEPEPESPVAPVEEPVTLTPPPEQPAAEDNKETVVESTEAEPVAPVEETSTLPPPPPEQPAAEDNKGGSGFKPDPALMDFGQASPEDQDLYTTRS